jgi:hypothetical protein
MENQSSAENVVALENRAAREALYPTCCDDICVAGWTDAPETTLFQSWSCLVTLVLFASAFPPMAIVETTC